MESLPNLRTQLAKPLPEVETEKIASYIRKHPEDFLQVYKLTKDPDITISWRALWICDKLSRTHAEFFAGKQEELIAMLLVCKHGGCRRLLLSILFHIPTVAPLSIPLLDYCFEHMSDPDEPTSVQALSIKMAYKLCLLEPELLAELKLYLDHIQQDYCTIGVKTTIRKIRKLLP